MIYQVVIMDRRGFIKEYQDFTSSQIEQLLAYVSAFLVPENKINIIPYQI